LLERRYVFVLLLQAATIKVIVDKLVGLILVPAAFKPVGVVEDLVFILRSRPR
jgi:hypothetical protein